MEKRKNVSREKFTVVYERSTSKEEVADKLGLKVATVISKANSLRKEGVRLKQFESKHHSKKPTTDELNSLLTNIGLRVPSSNRRPIYRLF